LLRSPEPLPLFYGSDESLDFVSRHRRELAPHFSFLLNDERLTAALSDKARFNQLTAEAGIAAPATLDDTHELDELRPPLLVKPKRKVRWKTLQKALFAGEGKARVFSDADELRADPAFQQYRDDLVVQEYIPGGEVYSYHAFADAHAGELAGFCGRKDRSLPLVTGGRARA
jgi:predicted ATP-grasp superfamily ATP-dependent carboligase